MPYIIDNKEAKAKGLNLNEAYILAAWQAYQKSDIQRRFQDNLTYCEFDWPAFSAFIPLLDIKTRGTFGKRFKPLIERGFFLLLDEAHRKPYYALVPEYCRIDSTPMAIPTKPEGWQDKWEPLPSTSSRKYMEHPYFIMQLRNDFPGMDVKFELEQLSNWLDSKGVRKKDYRAFVKTCLNRNKKRNETANKIFTVSKAQDASAVLRASGL